jgi:hypothetical protein
MQNLKTIKTTREKKTNDLSGSRSLKPPGLPEIAGS